MVERPGAVTFQGTPLTLLGEALSVGDRAPDFSLLDNALNTVTLVDTQGRLRLIISVPSLDTPVCNIQTRKFNQAVAELASQVDFYAVSADLPFAQARWCGEAATQHVRTLSDHRALSFGDAYGTHIKELRLDARAVFIVDAADIIRYTEYVPEITNEPDYDAALKVLRGLIG